MRTTLTLDDDVAAALEQLRRARGARFKALVNEVLREGLKHLRERPKRRPPLRTESVDLGRSRVASVDNVAEVLALAEGDAFR
jgi:hypothetical protein